MLANYTSVIYDLSHFGVYKIKNAIVCADIDDGITIEVSFDGGSTFVNVDSLNKMFPVLKSTGKIQVKISFNDEGRSDIYRVKTTGFFQNLEMGTTISFIKRSTKERFETSLGDNGKYSISLPRGIYDVYYTNPKGVNVLLMEAFNPETTFMHTWRMDKDAIIEGVFREIPWAKYCVFDTFVDTTKMLRGTAMINSDGDLSDGITNRRVKYWAIGFN